MKYIKTFENKETIPEIGDYVILNVKNLKFSDPNSYKNKNYIRIFTNNVYKIIGDNSEYSPKYTSKFPSSVYTINFYDKTHPDGWDIYYEDILFYDKDEEVVKYKNIANKFNL